MNVPTSYLSLEPPGIASAAYSLFGANSHRRVSDNPSAATAPGVLQFYASLSDTLQLQACLSSLYDQVDATTLNTMYGPPIEELFRLRPHIALTVSYGDNRQICKLELHPTQDDVVIPLALIDELVNEIVPPSTRGMPGQAMGVVCAGFCMRLSEYRDIWISQAGQDVRVLPRRVGEEPTWLAEVQFKSCQGVPR